MLKYIQTIICSFAFVCLCLVKAVGQDAPAAPDAPAAGADKSIVKGKIVDKKTMLPISDVSVTEIDADDRIIKGTKTDIEGNFVLKISNPKNRISLSYIGYKSIVQPFNGRTTFNFSLED